MPKRYGYIWEKVVDLENCIAAVPEAMRRKKKRTIIGKINTSSKKKIKQIIKTRLRREMRRRQSETEYFIAHADEIGQRIRDDLVNSTWVPRPVRSKTVYDELRGKERHLKVPALYDQCVHHAIMRQTIPHLLRRKYYYDCGSMPNAGQTRVVDAVKGEMRKKTPKKYALGGLDVYHFFENCSAESVMQCLRRIFKDQKFFALHEAILNSMGGTLAIGFYPSPWYGNLVLSMLIDHFVKEEGLPDAKVYRFLDDVLIFHNNKRKLRKLKCALDERLKTASLHFKPNWQVFPTARRRVSILTYHFYHGYTLVRKKVLYRISRRARRAGKCLMPSLAMSIMSDKGILLRCDSYNLRKEFVYPYTNYKKCRRMVKYVSRLYRDLRRAAEGKSAESAQRQCAG